MSNSIGSVVLFQTLKAFIFLNLEIHRGLKSSVNFVLPPAEQYQSVLGYSEGGLDDK